MHTIAESGRVLPSFLLSQTLSHMGTEGVITKTNRVRSIKSARHRLVERGWLAKHEDGTLEITKKGEHAIRKLEIGHERLPHPKEWDGRWRVLVFDIPEKQKRLRDKIRYTLSSIGFKHLQHSVWVYPFDCEDFITLFKADLGVGAELLYIIAEGIENSDQLMREFQLEKK